MDTIFNMIQDVSFQKSYFKSILKYVYGTSIMVFTLLGLLSIALAFSQGRGLGLFSLVLVPMAVLLAIAFVRIGLEALQSVVRSSNYVKEIARQNRGRQARPSENPETTPMITNEKPQIAIYRQTGF